MGILSRILGKKAQAPASVKPSVSPTVSKRPEPEKGTTYKVAGVSYREKDLLTLAVKNDDYALNKRELIAEGLTETRVCEYVFSPHKAELIPEPENPQDPNAIKVLVDGVHVGYIKAGSCSRVHKLLQADRIEKIDVTMGGGKYKYLDVVDYKENGDEIYELDKGDYPFYVHLNIVEKKA